MFNYENIVISISALLYFSVAVTYCIKREYSWSFTWLCYSLANIGLILAARK